VDRKHLTHGAFILEGIVINLAIITRNQQIPPVTRELENVAGEPDVAGTGARLHCSNRMGQPETPNNYPGGRAVHAETGGTSDLGAAYSIRGNCDGVLGRPLPVYVDGRG
jgi:hypothetical protein